MRAPARLLHSSSASSSSGASADLPSSSSPAITVDSDMVVILASLLCALICVAGLALVARCACRRRSSAATNPAAASSAPAAPSSRAAGGLKKKAIDALPTVSFAADAAEKHQHQHQQQQHAECAICLAEFAGGEELRVLPHCGHGFHLHCIDTWLGAHATCPSCRAAIIVVNNAKLKPVAVAVPGRCRRCGEMDPEAMIH